jgi:hypothetical protein
VYIEGQLADFLIPEPLIRLSLSLSLVFQK